MNIEPPQTSADEPGLGLAPAAARPTPQAAYRVLARKYRPSSFEDLIGQEPMVRTLSNAFDLQRIHQAYILTGVRGVGKTTTARILARAFNYHLPGQVDRPSIHMPVTGTHCQAIIESTHIDVIEMDAASHTGIDDVREIIESARYRPVIARTKVYIIDEVHMLSKQAFNGLLKTLEEPPEHVKFLFATTEIEKVPITVRSRCQRFDLRRIEAGTMIPYLANICAKEGVAIEAEALAMVARASEGSARDSLSLLDQAIAHGAGSGEIKAATLISMLGLADKSRIIDMFEALMRGNIAAALANLKDQFDNGAEPGQILGELAEFVHLTTRLKLVPAAGKDAGVTQEERERGLAFAGALSLPVLTRAWQILTKGLAELKDAPRPLASADMILVRLAFAADLPTPDEALRKLAASPPPVPAALSAPRSASGGPQARLATAIANPVSMPAAQLAPRAATMFARFEDVIEQAAQSRDIKLRTALERDIRLLRFEPGRIEFSLVPGASPAVAQQLMRRLQEWTGQRWMVAVSARQGAPSQAERAANKDKQEKGGFESDPFVKSVLSHFPGAKIVAIRPPVEAGPVAAAPAPDHAANPAASDEIGYADDSFPLDDDL